MRYGNASRRSGCGPLALGRLCDGWKSLHRNRPVLWRLVSSAGTVVSVPSRPTAAASYAILPRSKRIHPPDQDRPAVLPRERVTVFSLFRERMEGRPKTPSVVPLSCELPLIDVAFQRRRPGALRHQTEPNTWSARLTVRSALRTPIHSGVCLYTHLCGASSSRVSPRGLGPRPKPSSFSEPTTLRVQRQGGSLRASSPFLRSVLRLATETEHDAYDRLLLPTA